MDGEAGRGRGGEGGSRGGEDRTGAGGFRRRQDSQLRWLRLHDSSRPGQGRVGIRGNEECESSVKGRRKFSRAEIKKIRATLVRIRTGNLNSQQWLRHRLRSEYGFYISDFDGSRLGFTGNALDMLVLSFFDWCRNPRKTKKWSNDRRRRVKNSRRQSSAPGDRYRAKSECAKRWMDILTTVWLPTVFHWQSCESLCKDLVRNSPAYRTALRNNIMGEIFYWHAC